MSDLTIPPDRPPVQVPPADTPGVQGLLTVAVAVVVVAGLYLGRSMLIPITLAVLLSFLLAPLVNLLRRVHLGRIPSVLLAVLLALAVILALGGLIGTQVAGLAEEVPRYATHDPAEDRYGAAARAVPHDQSSRAALSTSSDHVDVTRQNQTGRRAGRDTIRRRAEADPGGGASAGPDGN